MKGIIRCKGHCEKCGGSFTHVPRLGYICPECKIIPRRFYIDLWFNGNRIRLFSDKTGQTLDSYQRAQNLLAHINYEIKNHIFNPSKYVNSELKEFWTSNLIEKFLEMKLPLIAPSYQKDYERMGRMVKDFFGTKDVREIRKLDIINFKTYIEKKFNFKPKSVKNILDFFKTFLRYLKYDLEIIDNVPSFPKIEVQPPSFRWLTSEDQIKLLNYIPDKHKPILMFLMLQGCRPGEARALKCKDIDLRNETIIIRATFSNGIYLERRKSKNAITIPIHPEMMDFLKERVKNNLPEAFVFVNPNTGGPYSENNLRNIWSKVRQKANISSSFRLYDATRHSFASQLVNSGSSIFKVSKLLGHSSIKMTEKYAHTNIENLKTDLKKLSLTVTKLSPGEKGQKIV